MARFERHGSELAARPKVAWGQHLTPKDRAALARGGPKLEVQHGPAPSQAPVAVDAPLREMHADPRVHCALS